jgi:hypothetical protein
MGRRLRCTLVAAGLVAVVGCVFTPITQSRIETAIGPTFANLVYVQMSTLGLPPMPPSAFGVKASCRRLLADSPSGSGEWTCTLIWLGPDRRTIRDTYELFVATDGCYTATASAESLGGPTLRAENGREYETCCTCSKGASTRRERHRRVRAMPLESAPTSW